MNKDQIKTFLGHLGQKTHPDQNRTGWVLSPCVLGLWRHENGKSNPTALAIRIEPGDSFVNCFSCGYHGKQSDLILEMLFLQRQTPQNPKPDFAAAQTVLDTAIDKIEYDFGGPSIEDDLFESKTGQDHHIFPEDWLQSFALAWNTPWAREYLKSRSVGANTAATYDLRADSKRNRVCIPVRDFAGHLRGLHGRDVTGDHPLRYFAYAHQKHHNPSIWLGEQWVDFEQPIIVVEGYFDLLSVSRVCRNVVSPLYANPSIAKLKRMSGATSWVTLLDQGKAGDIGRSRITKALPGNVVTHLIPTSKDAGEMTTGDLVDLLEDHVEID